MTVRPKHGNESWQEKNKCRSLPIPKERSTVCVWSVALRTAHAAEGLQQLMEAPVVVEDDAPGLSALEFFSGIGG
jgi:hypothetical protein